MGAIPDCENMQLPVLVVDDSSVNRRLVIRSLPSDWQAQTTQACNGMEALELLRKGGRFRAILLDLNMPVMDGYQLLTAIRDEGLIAPPVIVLSGDVQPRARERVLALGARAFMGKPTKTDVLVQTFKECGIL